MQASRAVFDQRVGRLCAGVQEACRGPAPIPMLRRFDLLAVVDVRPERVREHDGPVDERRDVRVDVHGSPMAREILSPFAARDASGRSAERAASGGGRSSPRPAAHGRRVTPTILPAGLLPLRSFWALEDAASRESSPHFLPRRIFDGTFPLRGLTLPARYPDVASPRDDERTNAIEIDPHTARAIASAGRAAESPASSQHRE